MKNAFGLSGWRFAFLAVALVLCFSATGAWAKEVSVTAEDLNNGKEVPTYSPGDTILITGDTALDAGWAKLKALTASFDLVLNDATTMIPAYAMGEKFGGHSHSNTAIAGITADRVTEVGESAFGYCTALTNFSLPAATNIDGYAFQGCKNLTNVSLPVATGIGPYAFGSGCTSITNISLPVAKDIGDYAFYDCTALANVSLLDATDIGNTAFGYCTSLTNVSLPAATNIDNFAFDSCTSLTNIALPVAKDIGGGVFIDCTALTNISLPDATDIGDSGLYGSFDGCTALTTVSLPDATDIGNYAFQDCNALKTLLLGNPLPTLGDSDVFAGLTNLTIYTNDTSTPPDGYPADATYLPYTIDPTPAVTLKLNGEPAPTASVQEGSSITLAPGFVGFQSTPTFTWMTDTPDVASLDSTGTVTGVDAGVATICCSALGSVEVKNGSDQPFDPAVIVGNWPALAFCDVSVDVDIPVTGVTLDSDDITLTSGDSETLTATVTPSYATDTNVTWESSDPGIASVDATGKTTADITGVTPGKATITVTTEDGKFTADCAVTVKPDTIPVTGVTLDRSTLSLKPGGTGRLTATVQPTDATTQTVTWKSDRNDIATVDDDGNVTAAAVGTCNITVTTTDGGFTATCAVTVSQTPPPDVHVTGVSLDETTLNLAIGDSEKLTATVQPENASIKTVTWQSDSDDVATVDDGNVTAVAPGTCNITAKTTDGGFTATCAVTVPRVPVTSVTLTPDTLTLAERATQTLTVNVLPENATDKKVTLTSSNRNIATVEQTGLVRAIGKGTAIITATADDGSGKTGTCTVTVTDTKIVIDLSDLHLKNNTLWLEPNEPVDATITATPDGTTFTQTGLPSGLILSPDGHLTGAVAQDETDKVTLTAKAPDGTTKTDTFTVEVTENPPVTKDSGGGGGCNGGFGILTLALLAISALKRQRS